MRGGVGVGGLDPVSSLSPSVQTISIGSIRTTKLPMPATRSAARAMASASSSATALRLASVTSCRAPTICVMRPVSIDPAGAPHEPGLAGHLVHHAILDVLELALAGPMPGILHPLQIVGMNCSEEGLRARRHRTRLIAKDAIELVGPERRRATGTPDEAAQASDARGLGQESVERGLRRLRPSAVGLGGTATGFGSLLLRGGTTG